MRGWTFLGISTSDLAADRIPLPMKFEDSAGEMTPTTERSRDGGHAPRPRMPAKRIRDFLGRQSLGGGGLLGGVVALRCRALSNVSWVEHGSIGERDSLPLDRRPARGGQASEE